MKIKKLLLFFLVGVFITNCVYATGETEQTPTSNAAQTVTSDAAGDAADVGTETATSTDGFEEDEKNAEIENAIGKVIENQGISEVDFGIRKNTIQKVKIEVINGNYIGDEFVVEYTISYDSESNMNEYELEEGDRVQIQITEDLAGNKSVAIQGVVRSNYIIILFMIFVVSIIVICGKKSIRTIISLIFSICIAFFVLINFISKGYNEFLISIISLLLMVFGSFIILGGFNRKSLSASLGTCIGVLISGGISIIFFRLSKLVGDINSAMQYNVNMGSIKFDLKNLLFVSVIMASIGAAMDVSMSIVSLLEEKKTQNPEITWKELLKEGIKTGREDISTMDNTLILIYLSSIITPILLFMTNGYTVIETIDKSMISEHIIIALSGSIGVMLTVLFTALFYAIINKDKVIYTKNAKTRVDGMRSLKL